MELFNFDLIQNTAPILRFSLAVPANVTGWTTKFYIRDVAGGNVVFSADGTISPTLATATRSGIFEVPLTANNTGSLARKSYPWTFERTNPGFEDVLGAGRVRVIPK